MSQWLESHWIELALFVITIVGVILRVERRMGRALTREEHDRICEARNQRVEKQLDEMRAEQNRRYQESAEVRNQQHTENREAIAELREDIRELGRRAFGDSR